MRHVLIHLGWLLWTAAAWTLGGYRLLPRALKNQEPLLIAATSLALGAGLTAILLTLAASLSSLTTPVILSTQLGWSALGLSALQSLRRSGGAVLRRPLPRLTWWQGILVAALVVTAAATLLTTLAPPTSLDATVYHLRIPREFLRLHRLAPIKDDVRMFQPLYIQMLFAAAMGLGDEVSAALIHWLLGLGTVVTAGAWARRLGMRSALLPATLFALTPLVIWESTSCFIDSGLALFTALGLLWASRPELGASRPELGRPALLLAALFAGLSAGSKFTGCASAALIGVMAGAAAWPDRRRALKRFAVIGAASVIIAAPWYIRNAVLVGNPIYPLANRFFGGPEVPLSSWHYGFGKDLLHLVTSPFDLLLRGDEFDSGWATGPIYLALIPLAVLVGRRTRITATVAGVLGLYWLFWFYSSPQTRLLLSILPLAAALAGRGLTTALSFGIVTRLACYALLAVSMGVGLGTALITARGSARVALGMEDRAAFLKRMTWDYEAFEQTNRRLGDQARLAVFGVSNVYYLDPPTSLVGHDNAVRLATEGFTHLLRIQNCDGDVLRMSETVIWHGKYWNPGSRFQGTYPDHQLCAQLVDLVP